MMRESSELCLFIIFHPGNQNKMIKQKRNEIPEKNEEKGEEKKTIEFLGIAVFVAVVNSKRLLPRAVHSHQLRDKN